MSEVTTSDQDQLMAFMGRAIQELGAAFAAPLVRMGEKLGLYKAMVGQGPLSPEQLAERTGTDARYVREWLCAMAAGGYVNYHPELEPGERFSFPDYLIPALVDTESPFFILGSFQSLAAAFYDEPVVCDAFRTGKGVGWEDHNGCLFCGVERFYRSGYIGHLVGDWIPALHGVQEKLERGGTVADVGCGYGAATIILAQAFPKSRFIGYDNHEPSVETARERAEAAKVSDRLMFEVARAQDYPGADYDLVTLFDCLHDMGDPVGAAAHIRKTLAPDGCVMIVEPFANDRVGDNLNPVGRTYYAASTMFCTPTAKAQPGGMALGAQAGEARLRDVLYQAGFTHVRRAAATPFNLILEARG